MLDLIIKNGQCYIDGELKDVNVAVKDGKIHKIGEITEELGMKFNSNKGYDASIKGFDHFKNE